MDTITDSHKLAEIIGSNDKLALALADVFHKAAQEMREAAWRELPEKKLTYQDFGRVTQRALNTHIRMQAVDSIGDAFWRLPKERLAEAERKALREAVVTFSQRPDYTHRWKRTVAQWQNAKRPDEVREHRPWLGPAEDWIALPDKQVDESRVGHSVYVDGVLIGAIFKNRNSTKWDVVRAGANRGPVGPGYNTGTGRQAGAEALWLAFFNEFKFALEVMTGRRPVKKEEAA